MYTIHEFVHSSIHTCVSADERSNLTDKVTVEPHLDFEHASYTCQGHSSKTTVAINQVSCGIMVQCLMSIGDYGSNFILLT